MSFEKLMQTALRDGAGVTLKKVKQSDAYRERLKARRELAERHGPRSHRGLAFRLRTQTFGSIISVEGERVGMKFIRQLGPQPQPPDAYNVQSVQIQELGERLIHEAAGKLAGDALGMANEYRKAKSAAGQEGLLRGLSTMIWQDRLTRKILAVPDKAEDYTPIPPGFEWVNSYFQEQNPNQFLPKSFKKLKQGEFPNCLGLSIVLAAWAEAAGARYLYVTEICGDSAEDRRLQIAMYESILQVLAGLNSPRVREIRRETKKRLKECRGWDLATRDWHHAIAIQLKDGGWFLLDPYADTAQRFPDSWGIPGVAKTLKKYDEVMPGLCLMATDGGRQRRILERHFDSFQFSMMMAERARFKLAIDPGEVGPAELLAIAPELEHVCDLLDANNPQWPRPVRSPNYRLFFVMFAWAIKEGKPKPRSRKTIERLYDRFKEDKKFRRGQLDDLIAEFCRHAEAYSRSRPHLIGPVMEFSTPGFSIGLVTLSNLASCNGVDLPVTLLLEHGNSQLLWHQALSPLPDFEKLTNLERNTLLATAHTIQMLPQQEHVRLKLQVMESFLTKHDQEEVPTNGT